MAGDQVGDSRAAVRMAPGMSGEIAYVAADEAPKVADEERHNRAFEIRATLPHPGEDHDDPHPEPRTRLRERAPIGGSKMPVLALTSDDGLAADMNGLMKAIEARGGKVKSIHVATDHGWSDKRIALDSIVIGWLEALK